MSQSVIGRPKNKIKGVEAMLGKAKILCGTHKGGIFDIVSINQGFINVLITEFQGCEPFEISYLNGEYENI
jgi:hypothetical protein